MRYTPSDMMEIIRLVEQSNLPVRQTLMHLDIRKSTLYSWLKRYEEGGLDALTDGKPSHGPIWSKQTRNEQDAIIELALERPRLSQRELAVSHADNHNRHEKYHESLEDLTSADVYYDRGQTLLDRREKIKLETLAMRKQMHYDRRASQLIR